MPRVPTEEEFRTILAHSEIYPTEGDRLYAIRAELFSHLDLDWRIPAHAAHVDAIMAERVRPRVAKSRETND